MGAGMMGAGAGGFKPSPRGGASCQGGDDFGVGREGAGGALRIAQGFVHGDLEDAAGGFAQADVGFGVAGGDQGARRTGARFIVSLAAIFDLDPHGLDLSMS